MNTNLTCTVELITPEIAKAYLAHNTANYRTLSAITVKNYAEDMRNGTFRENGEAIQFSVSGVLKNGQHRLHAIVESGIPQVMVVVRGVADDVDEYDWGRTRNLRQWGSANGMNLTSSMACAARIMVNGFSTKNSRGMITQFIEEHFDELQKAYDIATYGKRDSIGNRGGVCLAVYISRKLSLVNDDIMRDFFFIFNTGTIAPDQKRDPSPALVASRVFLTKFPPSVGGQMLQRKQLEVIMLALKDFKNNRNRRKEYPLDGDYAKEYLTRAQEADAQKEVV